jgi:(1->4)-alpha-D-glucan 1-alpha-D-glucosylmutase
MHKAMREAKLYTSWINPSEAHEAAMAHFIESVLSPENVAFRECSSTSSAAWRSTASTPRWRSSRSRSAHRGFPTSTREPSCGTFTLVDPDNRRPIDYDAPRVLLAELDACLERSAAATWPARDALAARRSPEALCDDDDAAVPREPPELFDSGAYERPTPMAAAAITCSALRGSRSPARAVVVPRLRGVADARCDVPPLGERVWGDTRIIAPRAPAHGCYHNVFTIAACRSRTRADE